jgi:hypothetical protein
VTRSSYEGMFTSEQLLRILIYYLCVGLEALVKGLQPDCGYGLSRRDGYGILEYAVHFKRRGPSSESVHK